LTLPVTDESGILITPEKLRQTSLLGSATFMRILAAAYHALVTKHHWTALQVVDYFKELAPRLGAPIKEGTPSEVWIKGLPDVFAAGNSAPNSRNQSMRAAVDLIVAWGLDQPQQPRWQGLVRQVEADTRTYERVPRRRAPRPSPPGAEGRGATLEAGGEGKDTAAAWLDRARFWSRPERTARGMCAGRMPVTTRGLVGRGSVSSRASASADQVFHSKDVGSQRIPQKLALQRANSHMCCSCAPVCMKRCIDSRLVHTVRVKNSVGRLTTLAYRTRPG